MRYRAGLGWAVTAITLVALGSTAVAAVARELQDPCRFQGDAPPSPFQQREGCQDPETGSWSLREGPSDGELRSYLVIIVLGTLTVVIGTWALLALRVPPLAALLIWTMPLFQLGTSALVGALPSLGPDVWLLIVIGWAGLAADLMAAWRRQRWPGQRFFPTPRWRRRQLVRVGL